MAFPLDIRTELQLGGVWSDISSDVYLRDAMRATLGIPDQARTADPSTLSLTVNNKGGKYTPRNAMSPLYGKIGRNTPIRVSLPSDDDAYLQIDGLAADCAATPDAAALDIAGDIDVRWEGSPNWRGNHANILMGKWDAETGDRSWIVAQQGTLITFNYAVPGTPPGRWFYQSSAMPLDVPIDRAAIRVTVQRDNGAGAGLVRFYWAESLDDEWKLWAEGTVAGVRSIFNSSAPLRIGGNDPIDGRVPFAGRCYRAELRNGINGPIVAAPDFRTMAEGTTAFTDSVGRPWTLHGSAQVRKREDRFVGEVSQWPLDWSLDGSDVWSTVKASGIMRRLGQGAKALDSTLRRRIPTGSPVAYWPLEEQREATSGYSPIPGVEPMRVSGVEFGSHSTLVSSAPLPRLHNPSFLSAVVPSTAKPGAWQAEFVYTADGIIPPVNAETVFVVYHSRNGTARRYRVGYEDSRVTVRVFNADDDQIDVFAVPIGGNNIFYGWVRQRLSAGNNGDGTFWYRIAWEDISGSAGQVTRQLSGTCGSLSKVDFAANQNNEGWGLGHVTVWDRNNVTTMDGSDDAYLGETAWSRMYRLGNEERIRVSRHYGPLDPTPIGYQRPDTVLNLMADAADGDGGLLLEDRRRLGLHYRDRSSMYTQAPALTLSYNKPGLGQDIRPVADDDGIQNDVTVHRDGGSWGRAQRLDGPLSIAAPPNGIGLYDTSQTVSLARDDQTEPHAFWRMHLGTFDGDRYPQVTVMLHKPGAAHLIPQILALRVGDILRLVDLPHFVSNDDVDLMVMGWEETLEPYRWEITFNCRPGGPWNVGIVGDADVSRADAEPGQSVLVAPVGPADSTFLVHTAARGSAAPNAWVTSSGRLTSNPDFEASLTGWSVVGGTIERAETPKPAPFSGDWSLRLVPDGTTATVRAQSSPTSVTAGTTYRVNGYLRCEVARTVGLNVNWYTEAGSYLSTSPVSHPVEADTWTEVKGSVTAPTGAFSARILPTLDGTPPVDHVLWADVAFLASEDVSKTSQDFPFDIRVSGEVARVSGCTPGVQDIYARTVANGWGTATVGGPWALTGAAADYLVTPGYGAMIQPATGIAHLAQIAAPSPDVDLYVDVATSALATGSTLHGGPILRANGNANFYMVRLDYQTNGTITATIRRRVDNAESQIASMATGIPHVAGRFVRVRFQAYGPVLRAKVWDPSAGEPAGWHMEASDIALTAAGNVGMRAFANAGSTLVNPQVRFANLIMPTPQRMTVVRSINGVTKAQQAGADIRLAKPTIVAL